MPRPQAIPPNRRWCNWHRCHSTAVADMRPGCSRSLTPLVSVSMSRHVFDFHRAQLQGDDIVREVIEDGQQGTAWQCSTRGPSSSSLQAVLTAKQASQTSLSSRSLKVTTSRKSSLPQDAKSVTVALMPRAFEVDTTWGKSRPNMGKK